jgi:hypothetical protein
MKEELLTRKQAAALLRETFNIRCNPQRLGNLAWRGEGPPYFLWGGVAPGRALYPKAKLIAWGKKQLGELR